MELNLLLSNNQYIKIKVVEKYTVAVEIKVNLWDQEEKEVVAMASKKYLELSTEPSIFLKGNNQGSIALAHKPIYYAQIKYIDI